MQLRLQIKKKNKINKFKRHNSFKNRIKYTPGDFPGNPGVKTLSFQCKQQTVQSLVRELRPHTCVIPKKHNKVKYTPDIENLV